MTQPPANEHPTLSSLLLAGAQEMDPESWSRVVNTFGPIVYRWCRTSGVAESDAADVVQEVFASVARGIPKFQREKQTGSFRSWLATITRNRVRDHFRRQSKRQQAIGGTEAMQQLQLHADAIDETIDPESIDSPIVRRVLESVKNEFEPSTWQAFWLTAVDSQPAATAANTVGISVASVYQAKSRVLRRLRQQLARLPS